ncbi:unnamed protein product [Caenorhabditis angaria]|uniref:Uncharacterized protein n=1 Tax=Caenorhabditis angaria TaxID=860376 RepID=A0A9P1IH66_9PELO|nr:unnamed protein product [Caenorhabditis angaria]
MKFFLTTQFLPAPRGPKTTCESKFVEISSSSSFSPPPSSTPSFNHQNHHQTNHDLSTSYVACDAVTRQIVAVLLSISDLTQKWAKNLGGNGEENGVENQCRRFESMFDFDFKQMSSVASKHALLFALGGVSIAALFVWYYQAKRQEEARNRKKSIALNNKEGEVPEVAEKKEETIVISKKSAKRNKKLSESQNEQVQASSIAPEVVAQSSESQIVTPEQSQSQEIVAENEPQGIEVPTVTVETSEQVEAEIAEEKKNSVLLVNNDVLIVEKDEEEEEEEEVLIEKNKEKEEEIIVQKVGKQQAAAPAPITMPKKRTSENEQIPEEPTPTKVLDQPLSLDIAQMSPASFSWSEEMEKSYIEGLHESSDMEPSPISPSHRAVKNNRPNKSRKGRGNGSTPGANKRAAQRRLHSVEERAGDGRNPEEEEEQNNSRQIVTRSDGVVFDTAEHGDHEVGYDKSDSPGLASQNSEEFHSFSKFGWNSRLFGQDYI